jgi:hypothetical protein
VAIVIDTFGRFKQRGSYRKEPFVGDRESRVGATSGNSAVILPTHVFGG